ncbi:MAG: NAD(P)-binding domain-containing protein, partial [Alphaproteobacteria bacterium]|nr:NAD(P)-binding domain-containing protein [Alphaproteobacteria bacterium]
MKIAIYGAGAIGGLLGAKLAHAGSDVTLIARGPHLAAMRENGLKLITEGDDGTRQEIVTHPKCTDDPQQAGRQDYVIVTLKAHSVPAVARPMQAMMGPETAVVTAINGVPWWYFYGIGGDHEGRRIASVDPDGALGQEITAQR